MWAPGLVNFVAVAHYFCLVLPAASTEPGARLLAKPCRHFLLNLINLGTGVSTWVGSLGWDLTFNQNFQTGLPVIQGP